MLRRRDHRVTQVTGLAAPALGCLLLVSTGCRGRAHEDLYRAKMASEIRVLEDQLYDADYQNRVLRDELDRSRQSRDIEHVVPRESTPRQRSTKESVQRPHPDDEVKTPDSADDYEILELPKPPALKDASASGADDAKPLIDPPEQSLPAEQDLPPKQGLGMPSETLPSPAQIQSEGPMSELPPPSELIPPGEDELMDDQIIPGPPLPPDEDPRSPPGKVADPKDAKTMRFEAPGDVPLQAPDHLELHDGLSGGHQFDSDREVDGLYLIVTVADKSGHTLSLDDFEVDADLTVVVEDPNDESDDPRVGRWDFSPDQVRDMVRRAPIDGIYIPIAWQDRVPDSKDVIVHIRMAAAEEEMVCQGRVRLEESVAASHWLPRG